MEGWTKLHRKFLSWEWFDISDMVKLFIFLLLSANHTDGIWRGIEIKRGQYLTGLNSLNEKTKISIQTLRTCLKRLEKTGEINMQVTNKYRLITICKYESYQDTQQATNNLPNKQLTSNQQATNSKQEEREYKNVNKEQYIEFDIFWNLYNKKKGDKAKCKKTWDKLNDKTQLKIIETLPAFKNTISDIQFLPFPATYLNQKRWNDELKNNFNGETKRKDEGFKKEFYIHRAED